MKHYGMTHHGMKYRMALLAAVAAVFAPPANASDELAKKHNCLACHQVAQKSVGPAYKEVAKKYKGQPEAAGKLAAKVAKGGGGVWGPVPMPPNAKVPEADIKTLVAWILKQ